MRIRQNEISGRPADWDKQSTSDALEIVNKDLLPVFQVIYLDDGRISLKAVLLNGDSAIILSEDGWQWVNPQDVKQFPIKRLFKYPSWKYPGVIN